MELIDIFIILGVIIFLLSIAVGLYYIFASKKEKKITPIITVTEVKPQIIKIRKKIPMNIVMEPCYYNKQCECV